MACNLQHCQLPVSHNMQTCHAKVQHQRWPLIKLQPHMLALSWQHLFQLA